MIKPALKGQRLVALFLLGMLLFNYPVMSLFAGSEQFLGIPALHLYLFSAWGALIGLMALIVEHTDP